MINGDGEPQPSRPVWRLRVVIGCIAVGLGAGIGACGISPSDDTGEVASPSLELRVVPAVPSTPPVVAVPPPTPVISPAPTPATVHFEDCEDVRAQGAAPIHPGDPGFEPRFDPDGNGVGCES